MSPSQTKRTNLHLTSYLAGRASRWYDAAKSLLPWNKEPGKSRTCRDPLVHEETKVDRGDELECDDVDHHDR